MIAVYASSQVIEANVDAYLALAKEIIAETRKENGCISYELVRGLEKREQFAFTEKWTDMDALNAHMKTPHFTSIVPKMGALTTGDMSVAISEVVL